MQPRHIGSGSKSRTGLARIYRETGLFFWFNHLRRHGVTSPVRGLSLVGNCLADLERAEPPALDRMDEVRGWITSALDRTLARHGNTPLEPLAELAQRVPSAAGWDPFAELAELLSVECGGAAVRNVRRRLNAQGLNVSGEFVYDLATVFVVNHLPQALLSFDPARGEGKETAWLTTVLYRHALRHALTERRVRVAFDVAFDVADTSAGPEELVERARWEEALRDLPRALDALPEASRRSLALYFGLDGRERSLRQVAAALGTSAYLARCAIVHGMAGLAVHLQASDVLDPQEREVARALFVEGQQPQAVAKALELSDRAVRNVAAAIGTKMRSALRTRTRSSPDVHDVKDAPMEHETIISPFEVVTDFGAVVEAVKRAPGGVKLGLDDRGVWQAEIGSHHFAVSDLVQWLRANARLEELDPVAGDWLYALDRRTPHDEASPEWETVLEELSARWWINAEALARLWRERAEKEQVDLTREDLEGAEQRIQDSLSSVAGALTQEMPWSGRVEGVAHLRVTVDDFEHATSAWLDPQQEPKTEMNFASLLRHRFGMIGNFKGRPRELFVPCVLEALAGSIVLLPNFYYGTRDWRDPRIHLLRWARADGGAQRKAGLRIPEWAPR